MRLRLNRLFQRVLNTLCHRKEGTGNLSNFYKLPIYPQEILRNLLIPFTKFVRGLPATSETCIRGAVCQ
jgi:hypothetical protein